MAFRIGIFRLILGIACLIGAVPILLLQFTNLHSNDVNIKFRKSLPAVGHEDFSDLLGPRKKEPGVIINRKNIHSEIFQVNFILHILTVILHCFLIHRVL